jgi:hypothetical protein
MTTTHTGSHSSFHFFSLDRTDAKTSIAWPSPDPILRRDRTERTPNLYVRGNSGAIKRSAVRSKKDLVEYRQTGTRPGFRGPIVELTSPSTVRRRAKAVEGKNP